MQCAGAVAAAATGYVLYRKLAPVVADLAASYKLLRQMEADLDAERRRQDDDRLRHQFEQTHGAARLALSHLCIELRARFDQLFAVHDLKERLRQKSDEGARAEARLDEFKVAVVARTLSMLCSLGLGCVVLRLQLCIAARYAAVGAGHNPRQHQLNGEFLRMVEFFSAENVAAIVKASVVDRASSVTMHTVVDRRAFDVLMDDIGTELIERLLADCSRFFLPNVNGRKCDPVLLQMRSELAQLLSSQSIAIVLRAALQIALGSLQPVYAVFAGEGNPEVVFGRTLPKFAFVFEKQLPSSVADAETFPLLDALCRIPELDDFSSIVFFPIGPRDAQQRSDAPGKLGRPSAHIESPPPNV